MDSDKGMKNVKFVINPKIQMDGHIPSGISLYAVYEIIFFITEHVYLSLVKLKLTKILYST